MIDFDTDKFKLIDKVTGEKVSDKKAKMLMAYWVLKYKIKDLEDVKKLLKEELINMVQENNVLKFGEQNKSKIEEKIVIGIKGKLHKELQLLLYDKFILEEKIEKLKIKIQTINI